MIGNRLDTMAWASVSTQVFVCPVWSCHTTPGFPLHSQGLLKDQFRHSFSLTLAAPPRCGLAIPPIKKKKKQRGCDSNTRDQQWQDHRWKLGWLDHSFCVHGESHWRIAGFPGVKWSQGLAGLGPQSSSDEIKLQLISGPFTFIYR